MNQSMKFNKVEFYYNNAYTFSHNKTEWKYRILNGWEVSGYFTELYPSNELEIFINTWKKNIYIQEKFEDNSPSIPRLEQFKLFG